MPVDTSIYGNLLAKPPSLMDDVNSQQQAQLGATQLAGAKVNLIGQQQSLADQQAVRALYQQPGFDPTTAAGSAALRSASPTTWLSTQKALLDNQQTQANTSKLTADAGKATAETGKLTFEQAVARKNQHLQQLVTVNDVPSAVGWINDAVTSGELPMQQAQQVISGLQSGQVPLDKWKTAAMMGGLTSQQQLEATKPTYDFKSTGGALQPIQTNAYAPGGVSMSPAGLKPIPMTASPDAVLQASTSVSNNRANIAKDFKIAGYDGQGNMIDLGLGASSPAAAPGGAPATPGATTPAGTAAPASKSPLQGLVDSIGTYQSPESVALQRVPAIQKSQILAAVKSQYPDYSPMNYTEQQAGIRAFSPNGKSGQAVKSFNVGLAHLDTLSDLTDKLDNGQIPVLNAAGNYVAQNVGGTAQTNFAAAKNIVTDEVVKAIVGGGGGVGDRDKAAATINAAQSPQQLKEAIATVKTLMGGQLVGLEQSYNASTGKTDFRSKYLLPEARTAITALDQNGSASNSSGGAATSGLPSADAIAAELARRGH